MMPIQVDRMQFREPGTLIANRYQIAVPVGAGGMGAVYYAFDHGQGGLPIALKTFHPHLLADRGARDSFLQEGRAWLELGRHPHIVEMYAIDRVEGRGEVFIAAELISPVDGKRNASLRQWVQPGGMPWEQAFLFGLQIVWGMQHAVKVHPGLVHRDLKPENVLVGADKVVELDAQRVRVTDFGLVAGLAKADIAQVEADTGEKLIPGRSVHGAGIAGTPAYMAPEQWLGEGLDERTDIYAWGLILAELLCGRMVVRGETITELKQQHLAGLAPTLADSVPDELRTLIQSCIAREKAERPAGWSALERELRGVWQVQTEVALLEGGWHIVEEDAAAAKERQMRATNTIGISYADISRYDEALAHFEKSLALARELGDRAGEGATLGNMGIAHAQTGQYAQALAHHEQHLAIARELGDRASEGAALGNIGVVHQRTGHYERALAHHEQRLAIARELGDRVGEGRALGNLGIVYEYIGQYAQALAHHEQHLALARELGDRAGEGRTLGHIGIVYDILGLFEESLARQKESLAIARELGDRSVEGTALGNKGIVYLNTGQYEKALAHFEQHLAIARELGDRKGENIALGSFGIAYAKLGQPKQALGYQNLKRDLAQRIGDDSEYAVATLNIAHLAIAMGNLPGALTYAQEAQRTFTQIGQPQYAEQAAGLIAQIEHDLRQQ